MESKRVLFVSTGSRKNVLISTTALYDLTQNQKNKECDYNITIVTEQKNIDIFINIKKLNVKIYAMNAETYLILKTRKYETIIDFTNTELSKALIEEFIIKSKHCTDTVFLRVLDDEDGRYGSHNVIPFRDYYFEKITYPLDNIHGLIKRGSAEYLIGLNIGENEHASMKPFSQFIVDLMNGIIRTMSCKFVLFGTQLNNVRERMILSGIDDRSNAISAIGLYDINHLAQAIDLCDLIISHDSFIMHLALVMKKKTVGMFYNTSTGTTNVDYLYKVVSTTKLDCRPCNMKQRECHLLVQGDNFHNCFSGISLGYVINLVKELLKRS